MRGMTRTMGLAAVVLGLGAGAASACHICKATPCVQPVRPAYECVTEMVPYTVMKNRTRVEYVPVEKTVMVKEPIRQMVQRQRVVCKPVYDTTYVQRQRVVCRPVYDTTYVTQQSTVCRPVSTTREVVECVMQPYTRTMTVPTYAKERGHCGLGLLCGKRHGGPCAGVTPAGCVEVTETCYQPTTVTRQVVETRMVSEVVTRQVPVTNVRMVQEVRVENVPVTSCRMVREVITETVPVVCGYQCVPKVVTKMVKRKVCETVPVTCYRKVKKMVPVCAVEPVMAGPYLAASPQSPVASEQFPSVQSPAGQMTVTPTKQN